MTIAEPTTPVEQFEAQLETQKALLADLATMGAIVTSILEIDAVLSVTIDMAIRLVDGEVGIILLEEDGELKNPVSMGVGQGFVESLRYRDDLDIASYCFKHRETVVLRNIHKTTDEGIVLQSLIASPIQTADRCRGVMIVINKSGGGDFLPGDTEALDMLLSFVAVALENSHLVKHKLKQQKVAQEMEIARQVQETILSDEVTGVDGVEIGAVYFPAGAVGGDFYDVLRLSDRSFFVVLGDVSNKGIPAALVMSACSGIIKSTIDQNPEFSVSELATNVNRLMAEKIIKDREMFVTLFYARFDLDSNRLTYCNAGHLPGLYWEEGKDKVVELAKGGPIVGQFIEAEYVEGEQDIAPGDRLFLFTDGLTEAVDREEGLFGRERAEEVFRQEIKLSPSDFCLKIKERIDAFSEGSPEESRDDFTIMQVKVD